MIIKECKDSAEVAMVAADFIVGLAEKKISAKGIFHIALSGGSTPKAVFDVLARHPKMTMDLVKNTHLWWGDERSVPHDHPDSNVGMARKHFIDPVGFPEENVHAPNGGADDLEKEALWYEEEMKRLLGEGSHSKAKFDLVWLGMGPDGHTASLFPGTKGLDSENRVFIVNEVPQLETTRLSLTFDAINSAENILLTLTGKNKADMVSKILTDGSNYPINRAIDNASGVCIADSDALSALTKEQRRKYITTN